MKQKPVYQNDDLSNLVLSNTSLDRRSISERVEEEITKLTSFIRSEDSYEDKISFLESKLFTYQQSIEAWKPRFDFDLWDKVKDNFEQLWPELSGFLYLAIEYELYEPVRSIFFDIRHLLQITGHLKERIYVASWLLREAEVREDEGVEQLAVSSLIWSYTSSGQHQDLKKAASLWDSLASFIEKLGDPSRCNQYRSHLLERLGKALYLELIMDMYEGGVRLAVRREAFEEVEHCTSSAREEIAVLAKKKILTRRLRERFYLCFCYHEGVMAYLKKDYAKSNDIFKDVIYRAEMIGWTRAIKGAKSWLVTLALKNEDYATCDSILKEITEKQVTPSDKRDGICHLLKAQRLIHDSSRSRESLPESEIAKALERFTTPVVEQGNSTIRQLCDILSVTVFSV